MSAKLIIHKFGTEDNFQTLRIKIEENDTATFGLWYNSSEDPKKKEKEKPRLIVKVVSDENKSNIDLDSCAQNVESANILNNLDEHLIFEKIFGKIKTDINSEKSKTNSKAIETKSNNVQKTDTETFHYNNRDCPINPLEYSLEKVKENNARIMENIHMLNRTLNYTKKKEILGLINPKLLRSYPCDECGKCFVYETGLRRHHSIRHTSYDTQQRWQFVWTCTECFQVWPRQDYALQHASQCCKSDDTERVREIKASSLLQCEFCEKVYTNIPRLLRHLKIHNVIKNYECNACNLAFSCYKTAEQHWISCLWLKIYYQFSLPKLLLCNACDRKFRNYDQLYNHRYKVGHFIPKTSVNEGNSVFIPTLVFQCEVCAQWFNSISQIQEHKNQHHPHFNRGQFNSDMPVTSEI